MPTYVALLRAINVGKRMFKMADLRDCLTGSGLREVETHIQTGNIRFTTPMRSSPKVAAHVEQALEAACGFDVPTLVLTPAELTRVYADALGLDSPLPGEPRRYVTFLKTPPSAEAVRAIEDQGFAGEAARVVGSAVHVWLNVPAHQARSYNTKAHKGLVGTTRDLKVVKALVEKWGEPAPDDIAGS